MIVRRIHHDSDTDLADRTNLLLGFELLVMTMISAS